MPSLISSLTCFSFLFSLSILSEQKVVGMTVQVFDNVLNQNSCELLHKLASRSGLGHRSFTRPFAVKDRARLVIEHALDKILTEMGDVVNDGEEQYVEYWTRQEWRHIEAHADVDENLAKEQDLDDFKSCDNANDSSSFRYPSNGHVLYLKIGSDVRGPTCIFPGVASGGDLSNIRSDSGGYSNEVELVVVPAKDGRLLRFPGNALHAVPRPTDLWFLPFVQGSAKFEPEEVWGRSVILFNTWVNVPPKDVPLNVMSECDDAHYASVNPKPEWICSFDSENTDLSTSSPNDSMQQKYAKLWLLGNERRRSFPFRTVKLLASSNVQEALKESSKVSRLTLEKS